MITIYATYDEYLRHGGTMTEEEFLKYAERASVFIDNITYGRIKKLKKEELEIMNMPLCISDIADAMKRNDEIMNTGNLKSVSNDGYSETYQTATEAGFKSRQMQFISEYYDIAKSYIIKGEYLELGV